MPDDDGEQCHWKKDQKEEAGRTRHRLGAVAPVIEVAEAPRRVVVEISGRKNDILSMFDVFDC